MTYPSAGEIQHAAVIGTGLIGFSWAHVFCRNGVETRMYDENAASLQRGYGRLLEAFDSFEELGLLDSDAKSSAIACVRVCDSLEDALLGVQWVQECVPEDLNIKREVFAQLDAVASRDTVLASSLSALAVSDVTSLTKHPKRCVGVHPTNPPHIIPLVEVIRSQATAPEVIDLAREFMALLGQSPIVVEKEIYGYVLNRLQCALIREAVALMRDGVASVADIDRCVTEGLGLRWALTGPFMVEELNASSIKDDLSKYRDYYETMWPSLSTANELTDKDIDLASEGLAEVLASSSHDKVLEWRDRTVLALRELKRSNPGCLCVCQAIGGGSLAGSSPRRSSSSINRQT